MSNHHLSAEQIRFIDDLAAFLATWNMPGNAARLYGYLLLMNEPVSLDDIARDLEISRSYAHAAAKLLESHGNARRLAARGTKRAFYIVDDDLGAMLRRQSRTFGRMAELISVSGDDVAEGPARDRLKRVGDYHRDLQQTMEGFLAKRSARSER
jgi:DNA-binding transcriptional regulator GbsR (MarR family)